jgi:uncharacterized protein (TIGR00369 family)
MTIQELNDFSKNSLMGNLGIEFTEIGDKTIKATMPVDKRTIQPFGYLHGGAMLALMETLASAGSVVLVNDPEKAVFGTNVSANHIKSTREGFVTGIGTLVHMGNTMHSWEVNIYNEENVLLSKGIATNLVVNKA